MVMDNDTYFLFALTWPILIPYNFVMQLLGDGHAQSLPSHVDNGMTHGVRSESKLAKI